MAVDGSLSTRALLSDRNFTRYLLARICATTALQMQSVAVGWQVYALTGRYTDLGFIGLAGFIPFVSFVLFAGQLADRMNRRFIVICCYVVECCAGLALLAFSLAGIRVVWPIFIVAAVFGVTRAFIMPTTQAMLPNLVPAELFPRAIAINSSTWQFSMIVGPMIAGLLFHFGTPVVYATIAGLSALALVLVLLMTYRQSFVEASDSTLHSLFEGLRFVLRRPVILGAISLDLVAVLFGGVTALLPAYARDVLHLGADGLGWLRSATGIGAALMAASLAFSPIYRHVGRWMFGGVAIYGLATIVFGVSTHFLLSMFVLIALGAGDMVSVYVRQSLVQLETPDQIRGRVSAVSSVFIGASNELGEFRSGLTAFAFGLVPSVVIGGLVTLGVTGLWAFIFPVLARMNTFPRPQQATG
ncbi:MAG: MFS transporter [Steroidobacteraceae bacterium]